MFEVFRANVIVKVAAVYMDFAVEWGKVFIVIEGITQFMQQRPSVFVLNP